MTIGDSSLSANTTLLLARRAPEDRDLKEWQKTKGLFRHALFSPLGLISFTVFPLLTLFFGILPNLEAMQNNTMNPYDASRLILGITLGALLTITFPLFASSNTDKVVATMFKAKKGLRESRSTAKKMGVELVPELTAEHVEARIRLTEALKSKRVAQGKSALFITPESDAIAKMLFQDLNRENIILSLINDRGIVTATGIHEALMEIETHPTPLWNGSL